MSRTHSKNRSYASAEKKKISENWVKTTPDRINKRKPL